MSKPTGKILFSEISRYVKISYFVVSLIPLSVLVFITLRYVYPSIGFSYYFVWLLGLSTIISLLGLALLLRHTNRSISSLEGLHNYLNTLNEVSKQFRKTIYLDILLENIVNSAKEINNAETASLLLVDEAGDLRFKVLLGDSGQKLKGEAVESDRCARL